MLSAVVQADSVTIVWNCELEADAESPDPEIAAEFEALETCSRTRMYNADEAAPAK